MSSYETLEAFARSKTGTMSHIVSSCHATNHQHHQTFRPPINAAPVSISQEDFEYELEHELVLRSQFLTRVFQVAAGEMMYYRVTHINVDAGVPGTTNPIDKVTMYYEGSFRGARAPLWQQPLLESLSGQYLRGILAYCNCIDSVVLLSPLIHFCFPGARLWEVTFRVKKSSVKVDVGKGWTITNRDGTTTSHRKPATSYVHTVVLLVFPTSRKQFILDITAAQFGWTEQLVDYETYYDRHVESIVRRVPFQEFFANYQQDAMGRRGEDSPLQQLTEERMTCRQMMLLISHAISEIIRSEPACTALSASFSWPWMLWRDLRRDLTRSIMKELGLYREAIAKLQKYYPGDDRLVAEEFIAGRLWSFQELGFRHSPWITWNAIRVDVYLTVHDGEIIRAWKRWPPEKSST